MKPFGLLSDSHNHEWSAFSETLPNGVNSRLQIILDETKRCAAEVKAAGGDTIFHGGDLFHVRGSLAPSVLNPTMDCYRDIVASGVKVVINAGNHDLEGRDASRVSSAITALEGVGCMVINAPNYHSFDHMVVIPWIANIAKLKETIEHILPSYRAGCDLLIHAPIDGVIVGIPDHGLDPAYLASLGYRNVFAGHYHTHKEAAPGVWSIGSLTAQTWSDVGAKAGFLIVTDEGVKWRASRAPSFVEIDGSTDPDEIRLIVDGNYVRCKITTSKESEISAMRQYLLDCGALGVNLIPVKDPTTVGTPRTGGALLKAGATLEASINDFIKSKSFSKPSELALLANDILATVRSAV